MKWYRISALVRRYFQINFLKFNRLFSLVYWPFINIIIWGVTSVWVQALSKDPHIAASILTGLILWQIVFRVNIETARGLYEELIHQNIVNLFSTPLSWLEWVVAIMIMGVCNMVLVTICSASAVYMLYGINLLNLGKHLWVFMGLLLMSGWFIGFFICGLLIYWGLKAQDFMYVIGYLFTPFSAIFYPLSALPPIVQSIGKWLPTVYVFEAMRSLLKTGAYSSHLIVMSIILNLLYLTLSLIFFKIQFERSKVQGLGRLG
jgi:ABC-2 type transport system permease protein